MRLRRRRGKAALEEYESTALDGLLTNLGGTDDLSTALRELVRAGTEQDRSEVLRRHPELASERGRAGLRILVSFAIMTGLVETVPRLQSLQERLRVGEQPEQEPASAPLEPDDNAYAILDKFCVATITADEKFLRTQDASDIRLGIRIWEALVTSAQLRDVPAEAMVDPRTQAAMLYARRYEIDTDQRDLDAAFALLREARRHVVPGADADLTIRLSTATWLLLRHEVQHDPADLDQAITGYAELIDMCRSGDRNAGIASANLGRALLIRRELTGGAEDGRRALQAYHDAMSWLSDGDPVLPLVQQQLAALSWRTW